MSATPKMQAIIDAKRLELYYQGKTDTEMAIAEGSSARGTIACWRKRNGLPPNARKGKRVVTGQDAIDARRQALYDLGLLDSAMAKVEGSSKSTIACWRNRNGLPPNTRVLKCPERSTGESYREARRERKANRLRRELALPDIDPAGIFAKYNMSFEAGLALVGSLP